MAEAGRTLLVRNVSTSLTAALTAGTTWAGKAQLVSMRAVNKSGSETWVTIEVVRSGNATNLLYQRAISSKGFHAETLHHILEVGDVVNLQAGAGSAIDVVLSGYEGVD